MYKVGDYVVYKRDICKVEDITRIERFNKDYYILCSVLDDSLKIKVPVDNEVGYIRSIITKEEAENLINNIPNIDIIKVDDKLIENEYRSLLNSNDLNNLIKVIKTTYLRNDNRTKNGKKIGEKDNEYFNKAEKLLYTELSLVLNMSYNDVKNYIYEKVDELLTK